MSLTHVKRLSCKLGGLILLFTSMVVSSAIAKELDINLFTKHPSARSMQISPDGKYVSVVFRKDDQEMVGVLSAETLKPLGVYKVYGAHMGVNSVNWVNNERLVYTVYESKSWRKSPGSNGELFGVSIDGSRHKNLFGFRMGTRAKTKHQRGGSRANPDYAHHDIIDILPDDKDHIIIAVYPWVEQRGSHWKTSEGPKTELYKLNIYNGKKKRIDILPLSNATALTDHAGKVRFAIGTDINAQLKLFYKPVGQEKWQDWSISDFEGRYVVPIGFTADNKKIYLEANVGNGTRALYLYDLKTKQTEKLFHDEKVDIDGYLYDARGTQVIGLTTEQGTRKYHYIDKNHPVSSYHQSLVATFKGNQVNIAGISNNAEKIVAYVNSDADSGHFYLFDTKNMKLGLLMSTRQWLDPQKMARTSTVFIETRDKQELLGYLTLPAGKESNLPMVVMPHGGPHGIRDYLGFDWEVQLLANRGYAVLQVNFRGSGGFGRDFMESGYRKWGSMMQDDLTDATQAMIDLKVADKNRICMYGASYGGYASLMGAIREPDLYKCVIGSMGVYDLPMMYEIGDTTESARGLTILEDYLGKDQADLQRRSPAYNADKVKASVMLIHGKYDRRAPIQQVQSLMAAFDKVGKKYQYIELGDEGHGYYDQDNRNMVYNNVLSFLDKHIGK